MVTPTKKQLAFLDWEFGVFFHFGIRTFYEGHRDWDMKEMSLEGFCPSGLDCENWIHTIKEAGAAYAILVCKHHDGFANWPSKYTDYSVANTPWKDGKGDVVREFVDACHKYDVKVGLYYSPAQFGSSNQEKTAYDDYFIGQISELLSNYGKIDYLWFDGCGSEGHEYDTKRIVKAIRALQPEILLFNMWDPDTRWVGNESGLAHVPNRNTVSALDFSVQTEDQEQLDHPAFLPVECDCRMRLENWFYSDSDQDTVKSLDELMGLYYYSVGRGANLLINIGPDRRGLLPDKDAQRLLEFGKEIRRRFDTPLSGMVTKEENRYVLKFSEPKLVNHLILKENLASGEHVERFHITVCPYSYGSETEVYSGATIGHKAICAFPSVLTCQINLIIDNSSGQEKISDIKAFYVE